MKSKNLTLHKKSSSQDPSNDMVYTYVNKDGGCNVGLPLGAVASGSNTAQTHFEVTITCSDQISETIATMKGIYKDLKITGTGQGLIFSNQKGDFYYFGTRAWMYGPGDMMITKKEKGHYRMIYEGQDVPPCDLIVKEKLPMENVDCPQK